MLDSIGVSQVTCNHLESFLFILDRLEKVLHLIHFVVESGPLILRILVKLRFIILLLVLSLLPSISTALLQAFLKSCILILLPLGHVTVNLFNKVAVVLKHLCEGEFVVSIESTLLHVIEFLFSSFETLITKILGFLFDLLLASLALIGNLLLNSFLLGFLMLLNLLDLFLVVSVLSVLLV